MKKQLFLFLAFVLSLFASAQQVPDTALNRRLGEYMRLNREARFEALMNYVHPSLYKHASRQQLLEVFRKTFDNDQIKIIIDSIAITGISPAFKSDSARYRKVDYWMKLRLAIKDTAINNKPDMIAGIGESLKLGFPGSSIRFEKNGGYFEIGAPNILLAIKDNEKADWMFLGYQKNEAFLKALLPQDVIDHFKLL